MSDFYYFGYVQNGHYLFDPSLRTVHLRDNPTPWKDLDCGLAPHVDGCDHNGCGCGYGEQGRVALHSMAGWTAMAFWDRSGDTRPNSNSVFIARGSHNFTTMVFLFKSNFPGIVARFPFELSFAEDPKPITLGQRLFEAYSDDAEWKNYVGGPVPRWDEHATKGDPNKVLPQNIRDHWEAAGREAMKLLMPQDRWRGCLCKDEAMRLRNHPSYRAEIEEEASHGRG